MNLQMKKERTEKGRKQTGNESSIPIYTCIYSYMYIHAHIHIYRYEDMYIHTRTCVGKHNTTAYKVNSKQTNSATLKPNTDTIRIICIYTTQSS